MRVFVSSVYKDGNGVSVRFATEHLNVDIKETEENENEGIQMFKSLFFNPQSTPHFDEMLIMSIPDEHWDTLDRKYSVGDNFDIVFDDNGISLKKI